MPEALAAKLSKNRSAEQAQKHPAEVARQPVPTSPHGVMLALQRSAGNHAVNHLLESGFSASPSTGAVLQRKCACGGAAGMSSECEECSQQRLGLQTKLKVNKPGDIYEQEADRIADQVLAAPAHPEVSDTPPRIQRLAGQPAGPMDAAPASVSHALASSGRPLETALQQDMEQCFGYDFSRVRVHSGAAAEQSARDVNAHAYTVGQDIVFGAARFAPATYEGRRLIAHELTHVVQQSVADGIHVGRSEDKRRVSPLIVTKNSDKRIMRKGFESTIEICHRVLESRHFEVTKGGLRVVLLLKNLDKNIRDCQDFAFGVTLTQSEDWWPDNEIGTCEASTGGTRSFSFANLSPGTYYLTIWRNFDHPYCCLEGDILVFDEEVSNDSTGCTRDKDPSVMDIVHGALDAAGFIPGLGAIPDGVNALIYVVEGDWTNAGISAFAMVPAFGDGAKLAIKGGKEVIEASSKTIVKMGKEELATGLKKVAAEKLEKEAAERSAKKAAEEKVAQEAAEKAAKEPPKKKAEEKKPEEKKKADEQKKDKDKDKGKTAAMRFQVQWNTRAGGPTFALVATAPWSTGVTTVTAVATLTTVHALVVPEAAKEAARPAVAKQQVWILSRPPAGIAVGGYSRSEYFKYKSYTDARVDVENLRGHNLKI